MSKNEETVAAKPKSAFAELDNAKFGKAHVRAMLVAGTGFLCDSYDNFVIGLIVPMLAYEFFGKSKIPNPAADGWLKAASSWGNMFGQISFAVLGDVLGRKKVYGVELIILIGGALLCSLAVWEVNDNPYSVIVLMIIFRFILGVGVGGDYPVSAVITSEFSSTARRGQFIAIVFAMQGFGIILGSVMAIIVLAIFKNSIIANGAGALSPCWRILAGFGVVPALSAVYWRLRVPETPRFTAEVLKDKEAGMKNAAQFLEKDGEYDKDLVIAPPPTVDVSKDFREAFRTYFSIWKNAKVLIGCAACWFFLDIGYYGTSLNTAVILEAIGYGASSATGNQKIYEDLWNRAVGTALINLAGTVPGYWFTVFFVESWGRKPIQYMGFTMLTILFFIMAVEYQSLKTSHQNAFVAIYAFAQFFFNFGPNTTTFIIPAEVFPTAVRSTGHGISAASGKFGAILAAQCFAVVANSWGYNTVLYIFSGCCAAGLAFSFWVPETKGLTLEELSGESCLESDSDDDINELDKMAAKDDSMDIQEVSV